MAEEYAARKYIQGELYLRSETKILKRIGERRFQVLQALVRECGHLKLEPDLDGTKQ